MRYFMILLVSFLLITGCSKDDDENGSPGNRSKDTKTGCQKQAETCQNGDCQDNGDCDCDEGYSGEFCEDEKTPAKIKITSIKVVNWPFTNDDAEEWDYFSCCPEMYVELVNNADETKVSTNHVDDANSGKTYTYNSDLPYTVTDVQTEYSLELWDYDGSSGDDYMGGVRGTFYNEGNGFPDPIIFKAGGIKYELDVEYSFN